MFCLTNFRRVCYFWEIEDRVHRAVENQPGHSISLVILLFAPETVHSEVLQKAHSSQFTSHPGIQITKDVLIQPLWWLTNDEDFNSFGRACPVKSSHQAPAGFLQPQSVPRFPKTLSKDFSTKRRRLLLVAWFPGTTSPDPSSCYRWSTPTAHGHGGRSPMFQCACGL